MIQKDLIQRLIQDISRFAVKMMGLKGEEALEVVNEVLADDLKIDSDYLSGLTPENVLEKLHKDKGFNVHQIEYIAEILAKKGEVLIGLNQIESGKYTIKKALILFDFVDQKEQTYSIERQTKIQKIKQLIK